MRNCDKLRTNHVVTTTGVLSFLQPPASHLRPVVIADNQPPEQQVRPMVEIDGATTGREGQDY